MELLKDKKLAIVSIINFIICLFGTVSCIYALTVPAVSKLVMYTNLCVYLSVFYYMFWGYKVPGAKTMKYIMIIFAIGGIIKDVVYCQASSTAAFAIQGALVGLGSIFVAFMSGRLIRVKENKVTVVVVQLFFVAQCIVTLTSYPVINFGVISGAISSVLQWAVIVSAYFVRAKYCMAIGANDYKKELLEKVFSE